MGVKNQSGQQKKPAAEKSSGDATADLIKKVIETTRCSPAQAELALFDNDSDLVAAIEFILDRGTNGEQVETWTEQKSKKNKRKEEEEKGFPSREALTFSGRDGYSARGGRGGRGGSFSARGADLGGTSSSVSRGPSGHGGRGGAWNVAPQPSRSQVIPSPLESLDEDKDWKTGPLEFTRTEVQIASVSNNSSYNPDSVSFSSTHPISFAAVAAAAARRENEKNNKPAVTPAAAPPPPATEPVLVSSTADESLDKSQSLHITESAASDESVGPTVELAPEPELQEESVSIDIAHNLQDAAPELQANATWTHQLKSDLGMDLSTTEPVPVKDAPPIGGVEFLIPLTTQFDLGDYVFEYDPVAAAPVPPSAPESVPQHSAVSVAPVKHTSEIAHLNVGSGDYPLSSSSPFAVPQRSPRSNAFGSTSSVSYTPSATERQHQQQSAARSFSQQPQPLLGSPAGPQHQQHHHIPPMFPPQLPPFAFSPYAAMYNPMQNVRPDDYAGMLNPYPFNQMNMDLSSYNTNIGLAAQSSSSSHQNCSESQGVDAMKFQSSQNTRDQSQASAVLPPPGFGGPHIPRNTVVKALPFIPPQQRFDTTVYKYSPNEEPKTYGKMGGGRAHGSQHQHYNHGNTNYHGGGGSNQKQHWS